MPDQTRQKQLRDAKRRQRQNEREQGFHRYQIKLRADHIERLKAGMAHSGFARRLQAFLEYQILDVRDYPQLRLLCWNRHANYLTRAEAFSLYERNWRHLETSSLSDKERRLIDELREEIGHGVINA